MLLNRMSLRSTAAVGAATLAAGATFAVSAFADEGVDPEAAASAALPDTEETAADTETGEDQFFSEQLSQEELQSLRAQAAEEREAARANGTVTAQADGSDIKEEEEEEEEEGVEEETPVFSGDPKGIALQMVLAEGWGADQFHGCLEPLWEKESNWNHTAQNPSSGAYGIPQALPGSKMASHGSDWQSNPATQIAWGIDYIKGRYGTPCDAWSHSQSVGWY
ncbi:MULTISPECIES: lytic transglycosylase domain-containing protein [unclassified Nocardiopsis]|uniref:aggregation-promoting factor C-terminal-like domain-containing protein n=1 Tax=unclassified Nocardiopsis TaxID=2649073 RepID=UPI0013591516